MRASSPGRCHAAADAGAGVTSGDPVTSSPHDVKPLRRTHRPDTNRISRIAESLLTGSTPESHFPAFLSSTYPGLVVDARFWHDVLITASATPVVEDVHSVDVAQKLQPSMNTMHDALLCTYWRRRDFTTRVSEARLTAPSVLTDRAIEVPLEVVLPILNSLVGLPENTLPLAEVVAPVVGAVALQTMSVRSLIRDHAMTTTGGRDQRGLMESELRCLMRAVSLVVARRVLALHLTQQTHLALRAASRSPPSPSQPYSSNDIETSPSRYEALHCGSKPSSQTMRSPCAVVSAIESVSLTFLDAVAALTGAPQSTSMSLNVPDPEPSLTGPSPAQVLTRSVAYGSDESGKNPGENIRCSPIRMSRATERASPRCRIGSPAAAPSPTRSSLLRADPIVRQPPLDVNGRPASVPRPHYYFTAVPTSVPATTLSASAMSVSPHSRGPTPRTASPAASVASSMRLSACADLRSPPPIGASLESLKPSALRIQRGASPSASPSTGGFDPLHHRRFVDKHFAHVAPCVQHVHMSAVVHGPSVGTTSTSPRRGSAAVGGSAGRVPTLHHHDILGRHHGGKQPSSTVNRPLQFNTEVDDVDAGIAALRKRAAIAESGSQIQMGESTASNANLSCVVENGTNETSSAPPSLQYDLGTEW